jgi:hypothetical protein
MRLARLEQASFGVLVRACEYRACWAGTEEGAQGAARLNVGLKSTLSRDAMMCSILQNSPVLWEIESCVLNPKGSVDACIRLGLSSHHGRCGSGLYLLLL